MEDRAETCNACHVAFGEDDTECKACGEPRIERTVMRNGLEVFEGKWAIDGKIGEGGMGTVYAATDLQLDRKVAIKTLSRAICQDEAMVARFEREAKMMAKLDHPNLVPIHAVGRQGEVPFIVMKFLEGNNLSEYMKAKGRLSLSEVVAIMKQICAGLGFVHARGVTHRDIKPANIFISPEGHVTILDLGVAHDPKTSTTRTGMMVGTPRYMAPEQIMGLKVDQRSDLYALGVVLFEMIAGRPPFDGESDFSVMKAHTDIAPPDPTEDSGLPKAIGAVAIRALGKKADERFQTAAELFTAFEAAARTVRDDLPAGRARLVKQRATPAPSQAVPRMRRDPSGAPPSISSELTNAPTRTPMPRPTTMDRPASPNEPSPTSVAAAAAFAQPSRGPLFAAGGVVAVLLIGTGVFFATRGESSKPTIVPPPPAYEVIGDGDGKHEAPKPPEPAPEPVKVAEVPKPPPPEPPKPEPKPEPKPKPVAVAPTPKPKPPPPAPAAVAVAKDGELAVVAKPGWAWFDLDGMRIGTTPKKVPVAPGKHTVRFTQQGYKPKEETVVIKPGELTKLQVELEKQ